MSEPMTMDIDDLSKEELNQFTFVDVREPDEVEIEPCETFDSIQLPLSQYQDSEFKFDDDKKYILFCALGGRSLMLTQQLHEEGITNTVSLNGGVSAINGYGGQNE